MTLLFFSQPLMVVVYNQLYNMGDNARSLKLLSLGPEKKKKKDVML